jgi:hypothetical protein
MESETWLMEMYEKDSNKGHRDLECQGGESQQKMQIYDVT